MVHVPYKGSAPAIIDILAGHVAVLAATSLTGIPHIRSGRLRALGVTTAKRSASVPDIPTVAEVALPGYESVQWYGMVAPAGTPQPIVSRLHGEVARIVNLPDMKQRFLTDGAEPVGNTPEEFGRFIRSEIEKWQRVARDVGIRQE
jgi:tripartite-type tricarboxylate transporter receptor subunit TctC